MPDAEDSAPVLENADRLTGEAELQRQRDAALGWVNRNWVGDKSCPICTTSTWTVTEAGEIRGFAGGGLVVGGGPLWPVFMVVCNTCGYTMLFNAVVAQTIAPPEGRQP